jgi:hypothetical protein
LGVNLQRKLAEQHKSKETGDHVRLIISILVTFTAVVLGLLISSVKSSYDQFESRLNAFSGDITELDVRLREYGEDAAPIRARLRAYVAAAIADTWPDETPPAGVYPKFPLSTGLERRELGDMLIDADIAMGKLDPPDLFRKRPSAGDDARSRLYAALSVRHRERSETASEPMAAGWRDDPNNPK